LSQDNAGNGFDKRRLLIFVSAAGVLVYMSIAIGVDSRRMGDALLQLGVMGCGLILGLSMVNYLLRFFRWQIYVRRLGGNLPVGLHLLYYISGFAFTVSPGKAGEAVRSLYLRDHGVTYSKSLAAFFAERLQDLLSILVLASLIVIDHTAYRPLLIGVLAIALLALLVASRPGLPAKIKAFSERREGRIARLLSGLAELLRSSDSLLKPRLLFAGLLLGVISWGAEGVGFYVVCQGLHIPVSLLAAVGIYAVAVLAGSAAFFLPAGIGGMEIVMTTLLVDTGASLKTAVIATILCRIATLWFAVLLGVVAASAVEMSTAGRKSAQVTP
jgi:glycosyltransferase 2 family protein